MLDQYLSLQIILWLLTIANARSELTSKGEQVDSGSVLHSTRSRTNSEASKKLHIGWWVSRYKDIADAAWVLERGTEVQNSIFNCESRESQY